MYFATLKLTMRRSLRRDCQLLSLLLVFLASGIQAFPESSTHALSHKDRIAAGGRIYATKGCAFCHGRQAQGSPKGPPLTHLGWWHWRGARLARQIENGGPKMPGFGDSLTQDEVTSLVVWLRSHPHPVAAAHTGS